MTDRVHHHGHLIYSAGTQVVVLVDVLADGGRVLHPRGAGRPMYAKPGKRRYSAGCLTRRTRTSLGLFAGHRMQVDIGFFNDAHASPRPK